MESSHHKGSSDGKRIKKITVPVQFGFKLVNPAELTYLQADGNYTILHIADQSIIVANLSFKEFGKILAYPEFYRINSSTIINMNYLKSFTNDTVVLACKAQLTLSRKKISDFRNAADTYLRSTD